MPEPLKLRFLGSLIEQLGAQLYPGATATIAELISNAWDADANNVWVDIPLGRPWKADDRIVVTDDGMGMSHEHAAERYLAVGRKRRVELEQDRTEQGRLLHGRKGIGKLAAFGTAKIMDCYTVSAEGVTSFRLNYDNIRALDPAKEYAVEEVADGSPLRAHDGSPLDSGTRITLSSLKKRRAINKAQFRQSLSRRFALDADKMRIHINGEVLTRFEHHLEFLFPRDGSLLGDGNVARVDGGWGETDIGERPVRWWIGFTEKPIQEKDMQGVSVLARGKMVHRPFLFQRTAGVYGQLGQEYLVGEVQADWLDEGRDIDDDLIQANRDQLQLEDARLDEFVAWGQELVRLALRERKNLRTEQLAKRLDLASFKDLIERLTADEQRRMNRVVQAISNIDEIGLDDARQLVESLVDAHEDTIVRQLLEDVDASAPDFQTNLWDVVRRFGLIDARRNQTIISARLKAIREIRRFVERGAQEVPTIHKHIKQNPWLLDPRWYLLNDEVHLSELGISPGEDRGDLRMDYLFALGPSSPYTHDELLVVEIKRGTDNKNRVRKASAKEVSRFHDYVLAAHEKQMLSSNPLRVTGLMIAQDYTENAERKRKSLEEVRGVRLVFNTWDRVLQETERLHEGWLAVTQRRAATADG